MVVITEKAASKAKEILTVEGKPDWGLKIFMSEGGCCGPSFGMDIEEKAADGDKVVEQDGLRVFMDEKTFQTLDGMQVDYIKEGDQEGFVIQSINPGAGGGCGCAGGSCG